MKKTIYLRKLIVGILPFLAMVGLELHVQAAETLQNVTTSHTHTAECEYHTHSSSCYHVHDASCYTNYVQHTASDEMVYDSCGCRHQTHYWHCNYCGRDWSSTTNNSADCREGHVLSDNGNSICHSNIFTCTLSTSDVLCGKSEGYLCGINDSETHELSVDNSLDSYASTYTFSIASTAATTLDSSTPYIFSYSNTDGNVYSQSSTESSFTVDSGMGCGTLSVQLMEIDGNYVSLGNYNLSMDVTAPDIISLVPDCTGWTKGTVTITVNASDDASGVVGYSMDGTSWQGENTFTVSANNTYTFYARDAVGNVSAGSSITVSNIDTVPPTLLGLSPDSTDWTNGTVTITVSASDNASGASLYSMDGINWQLENTFTVSANSTYTFYARDAAGNVSAGSSITISNIDAAPPVISGLSPDSTDWTSGAVTITVNASDDASGVAGYSMDGTNWQGENTFAVSTNGTYTFFARDAVGNISAGSSITISNIDAAPPVISDLSPDSTDWTSGTVTITVSASDDASGVAGYSMDGTNWQGENTFAVSINGTYTFYVRDAAGNVSAESSITIDNIGIDITDETIPFMITPIQAAAAASAGSTGSGVVVFIFFWIFRKCKIFDSTSGRKIGTAYIRRRKNIFYAKIPTRIYHMTGSKIEVVFSKNFVKSNDGKPIDIKVGGTFIQSSVREKIEINL